jgi:hypothetical protein
MKPTDVVLLGAFALVAACSREARSSSYFAAHPAEADRVLSECRAGQTRGPECANALSGPMARDNAARLEMYRKGFER